MNYYLSTPIGSIPFNKSMQNYYNEPSDIQIMKLYIKERKESNLINPHTFEVMVSRKLLFKGEKIEDIERRLKGMLEIKKGDIIKTTLSDTTVVLEVKDKDAILFAKGEYIIAHGIDRIKGDENSIDWSYGKYSTEYPVYGLDKLYSEEIIRKQVRTLLDTKFKYFTKALISIEKGIEDEEMLETIYDRFIDIEMDLINDGFDDIIEQIVNDRLDKEEYYKIAYFYKNDVEGNLHYTFSRNHPEDGENYYSDMEILEIKPIAKEEYLKAVENKLDELVDIVSNLEVEWDVEL